MTDKNSDGKKHPTIGFGGVPTDIDVRKLFDRFGTPEPGTLIPYVDICLVLGEHLTFRHPRFKTVTYEWRKKLFKEHNVDTAAVKGEGIKILTAEERVDESIRGFKSGVKKVRRTVIRVSQVDRQQLPPDRRQQAEKLQEVAAKVFSVAASESKTFPPPPAIRALPSRTV